MKNETIYTKTTGRKAVRVRFLDVKPVTEEQMSGILLRLNYLGYDFPDEDSVRDYFSGGVLLGEDQSRAVLSVMEGRPFRTGYNPDTVKHTMERAVRNFGRTRDWKKAGYLLPDGTLLDFSEGQYRRVRDHREISGVVRSLKGTSQSEGMIRFMNFGAVRCQETGVDISAVLTKQQERALSFYMHAIVDSGDFFYVDISNENGKVVRAMEYAPWNCRHFLSDVRKYLNSVS